MSSLCRRFKTVAEMVAYANAEVPKARKRLAEIETAALKEKSLGAKTSLATLDAEHAEVYTTLMAPFIADVLPGARYASNEMEKLVSRLNERSLGRRIVTDRDQREAIRDNALKGAEVYNRFYPDEAALVGITEKIGAAFAQVKDTAVQIVLELAGGKIPKDAAAELGKTEDTVTFLSSQPVSDRIRLLSGDNPNEATLTGTVVYDANRNIITNWDQIDGSVVAVDFYSNEADPHQGQLKKAQFKVAWGANNYTIGTYVSVPLHGYRIGSSVGTKTGSPTTDGPVVFQEIAKVTIAEDMRSRGATSAEVETVRDFMPIIRGRIGIEEYAEGGIHVVSGTDAAITIWDSFQNSAYISDEAKELYGLEADSFNFSRIHLDADASADLVKKTYFPRGVTISGQGCTRAAGVCLDEGASYDAYIRAYDNEIDALEAQLGEHDWTKGILESPPPIGPVVKSGDKLREELEAARHAFGADNVKGGKIYREMDTGTYVSPIRVKINKDNINVLRHLVHSGEEKFFSIQYVVEIPSDPENDPGGLRFFNDLLALRRGHLTNAVHTEDPVVAANSILESRGESCNVNNPKGTSDNGKHGHLCDMVNVPYTRPVTGVTSLRTIPNNAPAGASQTDGFFQGMKPRNPLKVVFLGESDVDFQKKVLALSDIKLEGTPPNVTISNARLMELG